MAKVFIEESTLTSIGDAIRSKTGKTELIDPLNMGTEISSIETGSGGDSDIPEEAFSLTGDCSYRFASGGWDWFIENYGNRVTTEEITECSYIFKDSNLKRVPFTLNVNTGAFQGCFHNAIALNVCPKIRGTITINSSLNMNGMFYNCVQLRYLDDVFTEDMLAGWKDFKITSSYSAPQPPTFYRCYSLRKVPNWWYQIRINRESAVIPTSSRSPIYQAFHSCYSLDEIIDIPVPATNGALSANIFGDTFANNSRVKNITFETDNGQPIVANWKSQTISLNGNVGHTKGNTSTFDILGYNSGITEATRVSDDTSYQALKNDPDWWTTDIAYSRYNHDSAVETINSLPDTFEYLDSAGGTNTIKFNGAAGSKTDGGAINTLTAEEMEVAAKKGWTVAIV